MGRYRLTVIALWIVGEIITGCATIDKPVEELRIVEGQIDNIIYSEVPDRSDFLSIMHVGFSDGNGISLAGIYRGLSKGKTVKLRLRLYNVIRGTSYYKVLSIYSGTPLELESLTPSEESTLP